MTTTISIRLDERLLAEVDEASRTDRRGRSEVVRDALELWLRQRAVAAKVQQHREGYRRHPIGPDEFAPVLGAQTWPK